MTKFQECVEWFSLLERKHRKEKLFYRIHWKVIMVEQRFQDINSYTVFSIMYVFSILLANCTEIF